MRRPKPPSPIRFVERQGAINAAQCHIACGVGVSVKAKVKVKGKMKDGGGQERSGMSAHH